MSAASCSRSTRGWGVPRAFLKLCGFFKSGAPSPPSSTSSPTTGRCTSFLVRLAFSPSRFLSSVHLRRYSSVSVYLLLSLSGFLFLRSTTSPFLYLSAPPSSRFYSCMPLALFPTRSPASAAPAWLCSFARSLRPSL